MSTLNRRAARVALAWANDVLQDVWRDLHSLRELDEHLTAVEVDFDGHYPGVLRVAAGVTNIEPEVTSQADLLGKAREGLDAAMAILSQVEKVLRVYPDDKTAIRAKADAATMIARFEKHEAAAAKVIRTLAKKEMPSALKKYAAQVEKLVVARFVNPDDLQVIPWVAPARVYVEGSRSVVKCLQFQVVFRTHTPPPKPDPNDDPNQAIFKKPRTVELIASEDTAGPPVVRIQGMGSYSMTDLTKGPDFFAEKFLEKLQGWTGLKGEGAANAARLTVARNIASALWPVSRSFGSYDAKEPKVGPNGLNVMVSFRHNTRWEDEGWHGEHDQNELRKKIQTAVERAVGSYKDKIRQVSTDYGEKGWWSIYVVLK